MSIFRLASALVLSAALLLPTTALAAEDCGNCVDDDGDLAIDRSDPECTARANGGNQGIGDESEGKVLAGCAKSNQKAGVKFVLGVMKRLQKCNQAAAACIQLKPGDAACQAKATEGCAKSLAGIPTLGTKLEAALVAKCGGPENESIDGLRALAGLGFSAEETPCQQEGGPANLSTTANVASCIRAQHFCRAQHLVVIGTPRTRELLTFSGRNADAEFPCLDDPQVASANGGFAGVFDPSHAKPLLKCSKTIDKLSLALLGAGAKSTQTCLNAGIACLQVKPQDSACLAKARTKCAAAFGKLQHPTKGAVAKIGAKFVKACGTQPNLSPADLGLPNGLGLSAQIDRCTALGDGSVLGITECFGEQAFCEGGRVLEREVPRARELADLLNVDLSGF